MILGFQTRRTLTVVFELIIVLCLCWLLPAGPAYVALATCCFYAKFSHAWMLCEDIATWWTHRNEPEFHGECDCESCRQFRADLNDYQET